MAEIRQTAESLLDNTSLAGFWNFKETFPNEYKEILKNADNQQRRKLREKFRKAKAKRKKQQKSNQQKKQESKEKIEKNKQKTKNENQRQEYLRQLARQKVVKVRNRRPSQQEDHMVINRAAIQKNFSAIQKNFWTLQKLETQPIEKCSIKFKKQNMNLDSIIEKAEQVAVSNHLSLKAILKEYKDAKMRWKEKCLLLKKEKLTSMIALDEMSYLHNQLKLGELCPDFNAVNMFAPCNFWLKAFTGTINIALTNQTSFPGIESQFVGPRNLSNWYRRGYYGAYLATNNRFQNSYFLQELAHVEIMKDLVQNIFSDGLMIAKGDLIVIPSLADIKQGGVIYNAYKSRYPNSFNDEIPIENWKVIEALRDDEKETADDATYWEINNKQRGVAPPRQTIRDINDNNFEALLKNVPKVFANRPELYLRYVVNNYKNNGKNNHQGIITWVNVKAGGPRDAIYHESTLNPAADMIKSKYFEVNHANLIFFTPVHANDNNTHLKCSYYDPNYSIELHVKALIEQMINNLRTKVIDDNIIIKDEIDWISPEDIEHTISWHALFGYATHGVCAQVTYLFALLWGKFGLYFKNPKHLWCHLSRTLNWSIPALDKKQKQKLLDEQGIKSHSLKVDKRLNQLIPSFKSFLQRIMLLGNYLYKDLDSERYVTALITMIMKVEKMYKLGEKIGGGKKGKKVKKNQQIGGGKKGKKVRKHQGILQIGGNSGRLKKGYRYSGKKLKSGLPQIIKCKSKKC